MHIIYINGHANNNINIMMYEAGKFSVQNILEVVSDRSNSISQTSCVSRVIYLSC